MQTFSANQNQKELVYFFLTTFGISWGVSLLIIFRSVPEMPFFTGIVYGPMLSAFLLTYLFKGKSGLQSFFKRFTLLKAPIKIYVFITLGFFLLMYSGKFVWNFFTDSPWSMNLMPLTSFLPILLFQIFIPGLGEEPGWRGFALPRLLNMTTPLKASLVLGLVHWLWHLPTFWLGTGMHNVPALLSILYVIPWTILFTWVYLYSKGSIAVSILYHGIHGALLSLVGFMPSEVDVPISTSLITTPWIKGGYLGPYLVVLILLWAAAIVVNLRCQNTIRDIHAR